ncbi:MAG TPA: polysaccharide deacetylase family protein [Solirubrobacterales bacterium]|jgi:peptidoglycan/xylan/chitin deacetylase (PgdA/CDA1 family)
MAVASTGAGASGEGASGDLVRAQLAQHGRDLVLGVRTAAPVPLAKLDRLPSARRASRYLCFALRQAGRRGERLLCLGGPEAHRRAGLELRNAAGHTVRRTTLAARLVRPSRHRLTLAIDPRHAGLAPHRYRWRVLEGRGGCRGGDCEEAWPGRGTRVFRLRPVRPVGCTGGSAGLHRNGPRDGRSVALTFDDGPSSYTDTFLDVLRDKHARGTFFEVGQEMSGRAATMRRILREGSEIGNHTTHHDFYPGYWDLAGTNALIRSATHFEPCLFRPPGGAVDSAVVSAAGEAGLQTILWDVDPADWTNPGSGAVYSRIVSATRAGSIVLMHDGGGDRGGTLAALPGIIDTLRQRGYRFVTVSELLGHRILYRPYG